MSRRMMVKVDDRQKTFDSVEELIDWVTNERRFWEKIQNNMGRGRRPAHFWNVVSQKLKSLQQVAINLPNVEDAQQPSVIQSAFKTAYNDDFFSSESSKGKFIERLSAEKSGIVAAFAASYLLQLNENYEDLEALTGALEAFSFETGLRRVGESERAALEGLRSEWEQNFQQLKESLQAGLDDMETTLRHEQTRFTEHQTASEKFLAGVKAEWRDSMAVFQEQMALQAPVQYWAEKGKQHLFSCIAFGTCSLLAGVGAGIWLISLAREFLIPPVTVQDPANWHPAYWQVAVLLISAALSVWVIRILVKLLLSNLHLLSDAKERVTMVQTYLALLEAKKTEPEDRKLIIAALFRPATTGMVKDDGMPLFSLDAITRTGRP